MPAWSEGGSIGVLASGAKPDWLGHSLWQVPGLEISRIKSWPSIMAMSYHRSGGELIWRGDRHRLVLIRDELPPMIIQVEQGRAWQTPLTGPGTVAFYPPGLTVRAVPTRRSKVRSGTLGHGFVLHFVAGARRGSIPVRTPVFAPGPLAKPNRHEFGPGGRRWLCRQDPRRKPWHGPVHPPRSAFYRASPAADQQGPFAGAVAARTRLRRGASRRQPLAHRTGRRRVSQCLSLQPLF